MPVHFSATSHTPAEARHVVVDGRNTSLGQAADAPLHDSAVSQTSAAGRHTPPFANASVGHAAAEPVHDSATSQGPATGRHTFVDGAKLSAGHAAELPLQTSAMSQGPAAARHVLPGGASRSGGHAADVPLHDSATSQPPFDGRQTPPLVKTSVGHVDDVPVHSSATSHGPAAARHTVVAAENPVATHVVTPPVHEIVPVSHGLPVLHGVPAVHAPQPPSTRQICVPPQLPPSGAAPVSWQTGTPVPQAIAPVLQTPASHEVPAAQAAHVPLARHTRLLPHAVPGGCCPLATQPTPASLHDIAPVRHGSDGWQVEPCVHATQPASPEHT